MPFVVAYIDLLIVGIAFIDEVFPIGPTIIIAIPVKYLPVAQLLVPCEGFGTKEVLAMAPNIRPHTLILIVVAKRRMHAVEDCLQCCLGKTSKLSTCTSSIADE